MRIRELAGKFALVAAGCLLAAGAGELMLRVYAAVDGEFAYRFRGFDPLTVQIRPHGESGYRQIPGARIHYRNGTVATANAAGYRGPAVVVPKPPGVARVILLGGSTTHGFAVSDDETLDAFMRRWFAERLPGRKVEVVNLAFDGYDSYQMLVRLQTDGPALEPDVIVVNAGINDVRNARFADLQPADPRTILWSSVLDRLEHDRDRGGPTLWTRVKHLSYLARFPGFFRDQRRARREYDPATTIPVHDDAVSYFEHNLRRIADVGRDLGAAVLFATPASALRRAGAPAQTATISYWLNDAEETQQYRDRLAESMSALVAGLRAEGRRVDWVRPDPPGEAFLDDCHLNADGNRFVAAAFAEAALPWIRESESGP